MRGEASFEVVAATPSGGTPLRPFHSLWIRLVLPLIVVWILLAMLLHEMKLLHPATPDLIRCCTFSDHHLSLVEIKSDSGGLFGGDCLFKGDPPFA